MEKVRLLDKFTWQRRYRAAPTVPLYYLDQDGCDVFFVNNSGETLDSVSADSCGMQTLDDEVMSVGGTACSYEGVKPGEAVKVERYDTVLDSDFVMQLDVAVSSPSKGIVTYRCWSKGGVTSKVLRWDDGRIGSGVSLVREDHVR
jgi:hypothetical protein